MSDKTILLSETLSAQDYLNYFRADFDDCART